jgi:energy-converting hydrogenase Eha subunit A
MAWSRQSQAPQGHARAGISVPPKPCPEPKPIVSEKIPEPPSTSVYVLAVLLGAATGYVNVRVEDLMLTAVMVTAFAMFLAFLRPERPWRWGVVVSAMIPIGEVVAFKLTGQKLNRAGISEAILAVLPANAGAYGGAALRTVIRELWKPKVPIK